jgi:hypothetical protein
MIRRSIGEPKFRAFFLVEGKSLSEWLGRECTSFLLAGTRREAMEGEEIVKIQRLKKFA